jgi:four helix bundle protein
MESGNKKIQRFEDIVAWQKARELVKIIYKMTNDLEDFRKDFGLKDQIRRASVSSMSNISEGFARNSDKEFANFLNIARGSVAEVQCQLYVSLDLGYIDKNVFDVAFDLADETSRLLMNFMKYLKR